MSGLRQLRRSRSDFLRVFGNLLSDTRVTRSAASPRVGCLHDASNRRCLVRSDGGLDFGLADLEAMADHLIRPSKVRLGETARCVEVR